jgi:hypothetical protein
VITNLTHLVGEYRSATHRLEYPTDHPGLVAFDAGEGMLLCVNELDDDRLELFASPGYMSADELAAAQAQMKASNEDCDILESRRADGADWTVDLDPESGLVTLAAIRLEGPWNLAGFIEAVETFQREYRTWEARLRATRDPETVLPTDDEEEFIRAIHLRA